jgi:integrase/recombinase XerD
MNDLETNPLEKWDKDKKERWGLSKRTEQEKSLTESESYAVSKEEVHLMEENVGDSHRIRDQLIIRLLWQTGIRRGEASGLKLNDINRDEREITIRRENAKNSVKRIVAFQESLLPLLDEWRSGRRLELLGVMDEEDAPHDRLLVGERGDPLSGDRINEIVRDSAKRAGINRRMYGDANATIDPKTGETIDNRWKITAHNVRHGYGSYLLNEVPGENQEARLWEVSKQMGHSSVEITEKIYIEQDPRAGLEYVKSHGPD